MNLKLSSDSTDELPEGKRLPEGRVLCIVEGGR